MTELNLDKHYLVVGMGLTGISCVRYLSARGCRLSVIDSRSEPGSLPAFRQEFPDVPCHLGGFDVEVLKSADVLVMSPGVPLATAEIQQALTSGVEISSDIELFLNAFKGKIAAITGSNAKSTVTQWLGDALIAGGSKTLVAGNIGLPVLDAVDGDYDIAVLELSSFQLELLPEVNADVATILNVSEDHMDRYDSMASYQAAKLKVYSGASVILVNRDDSLTLPDGSLKAGTVSFGSGTADSEHYGLEEANSAVWLVKGQERLITENEIALRGRHNCLNALAVTALADCLGNPREATLEALRSFKGLPFRCQLVGEKDGVQFFNDSKATNVGSTLAALNGLAGSDAKNLILLVGGQGKEQDFSPLTEAVQRVCKSVFAYGEDKALLKEALPMADLKQTLAEAFAEACANAEAGDSILLSPACASFDQFKNFEARGDAFNDLVEGVL